jgi:hypothetical protein
MGADKEFSAEDIVIKFPFHTSTGVFKRSLLNFNYSFWDKIAFGDRAIFASIATKSRTFYINKVYSHYRVSSAGIWTNSSTLYTLKARLDGAKILQKELGLNKKQINEYRAELYQKLLTIALVSKNKAMVRQIFFSEFLLNRFLSPKKTIKNLKNLVKSLR